MMAKTKSVKKIAAKAKKTVVAKTRLTRAEMDQKRQLAYVLYMANNQQNVIAEYVNVTTKTISQWAAEDKWKEKRSAATVTRPELVNKILQSIGKLLDDAIENPEKIGDLGDKLAKMAKTIEALDKKNNPVSCMEWLKKQNDYIMLKMQTNKALTPEFLKQLNAVQIEFVNQLIAND